MKYLFSFLIVMCTMILSAQSLPILKPLSEISTEQVSLANPYVGTVKLAYNFDDSRPLGNNIIFSAGAQITPIRGPRFAVPILGIAGLGSDDIFNPASGLNIGIFPYYVVSRSETIALYLHAGGNYKTIVEGVEVGETAPQQLKFLVGLELIYAKDPEALPITISVTPSYLYNVSDLTENTGALELTAIFPVASGIAILAESITPFNKLVGGQFRFAAVTTF